MKNFKKLQSEQPEKNKKEQKNFVESPLRTVNSSLNTFTNLTPRRGSLPGDYNRPSPRSPKFPLSSPTTPQSTSPTRLNFNFFSPILEDFEETGEILEGLLRKGHSSSGDKFLSKLLDQKEQDIQRLETEKKDWLKEKQEWKKEKSTHLQLQKQFTNQNKELEQIQKDLAESNEIIYQETKEKEKLSKFFYESQTNNRKLEQKLTREIDENHWLRNSFQRTKDELTEKVEELTKLKRLGWEEKEQWHKVFTEQEEKYEQEKKVREKKFNKQINNLRTFQLTADTPPFSMGRGRPLHKKAFSLSLPGSRSISPRGSMYEKDEEFINIPPKTPVLFSELQKANACLTSSPLKNEDTNPLEVQNTPTTPDFDFSQFDELLEEVNDLAQEKENNQGLLSELEQSAKQIEQLKTNQTNLEKAYKILADENVEQERVLKNFNEKELKWEQKQVEYERLLQATQQEKITQQNKNQKLTEELAEVKYKLAETQKKVQSLEKTEQKTSYQLKQEIKKNKELTKQREQYLNELENETDKWDDAIQECQDLFAQLEAKTEINYPIKK